MMRKFSKSVLGLLLALCLLVPCFGVAEGPEDVKTVWLTDSVKGGQKILAYLGQRQEVEIPETIEEQNVVEIGHNIFANCEQEIEKVTIPATVIKIDPNAFDDCENLTIAGYEPSFAEQFATEYKYEFISLGKVNDAEGSAESNEASEKVLSVTPNLTDPATATDLTIPATATDLTGPAVTPAPTDPATATDLTIPATATDLTIPATATDLTGTATTTAPTDPTATPEVAEPTATPEAGDSTDETDESVQAPEEVIQLIEGDPKDWNFSCEDGTITLISYRGTPPETVEIPQTIKSIPYPVVRIRQKVLGDGNNTTKEVIIPAGVKTLDEGAFANCNVLEYAALPDTLESIGSGAFAGCYNLTDIEIPASVNDIGANPFARCASLTEIPVSDGNETLRFEDGLLLKVTKIDPPVTDDPSAVAGEPAEAYTVVAAVTGLSEVQIPEGTVEIADNAFLGCYNLKTVEIPEGVTLIGPKAFYGCVTLTTVSVPDSIASIGSEAFAYCFNLKTVSVPEAGIADIVPADAFAECGDDLILDPRVPEQPESELDEENPSESEDSPEDEEDRTADQIA